MWNLFYRKPRLLLLTICLILVWGLTTYQVLPRAEDPTLTQRQTTITTLFPGASPYRVEALVTEKIEEELFEIEEIDTIESTSRSGISTIVTLLKETVADVDPVWARVRDKLDDVTPQLPAGASHPEFEEPETSAFTLIAALTWNLDPPANYAILKRLVQELEDALRTLPGTKEVELSGDPEEEIIVEINPADLAALELTAQDLSQQIRMSDAKVAAGQLRSPGNDLLIEVDAELNSLDRIRRIPIRSSTDSQFARLGDIALVKKGVREPPSSLTLIDGHPAITLAVLMEPGRRIDQWTQRVHQVLADFQERLPEGVALQPIFDQNQYVEARLGGLFTNLLLGVFFIFVTTLVIMGWRSALIVSMALPLSILMVLGGMNGLGIPLHQMSVTGLVIALGLLIDNAIVVVDEVQQKLKQGYKPRQAIAKGMGQLAVPLLASTLTTVFAFMPIALMPGASGEFVSTIGRSVILALLASLLLSLTIIPGLSGRLLALGKRQDNERGQGEPPALHFSCFFLPPAQEWWNSGFTHAGLTRVYRRVLQIALSRPILSVILALTLPVTGFLMSSTLPEQFFPPADRDQFQIEFELPSSTSLEQTQAYARQAREVVLQHPEVTHFHWFIGENAPAFYYNLPRDRQNSTNYAHAFVQLATAEDNSQLLQTLQNELDVAFPSAQVLVRQLEQGPPFAAPLELRLYGPELEQLRELGSQARAELAQVANVTHTQADLSEVLPTLGLQVDEEQARLAGLDNTLVAQQLEASLEGVLGGSVLEATEELPVRVRVSNRDRGNLNQITSLDLLAASPAAEDDLASVPISALGKLKLIPEIATITRRNGRRVNTVQGFISAGVLPSEVLADFKQRLETNLQFPPGYSSEFGGEFEERTEAVGNLASTVGVLVVLMIATLVLSFGSFRLAGIILLVGISSIGLGLASLWIFGYPLGFMAILGTVGLVGVAINDSIVVLAALQADPQARWGNREATQAVIVRSTRHVLATTLTTIAGFTPLLLNGGGFWPPLAICIAGGVSGATLLALLLVPCAYLLLKGNRYARRQRQLSQSLAS